MKRTDLWFALGAATPIWLIVAWMLLDTACSLDVASKADESVLECYRAWIGALSGWAAAGAAVVTLFVLKQTLSTARESNEILETQTRVVTGNLLPVFNHNGKAKSDNREIFRFWNYNRRDITILSIRITKPDNIFFGFLEYGRNDPREKDIIKNNELREALGNLLEQRRRVSLVDIVPGTPVGHRCRPITFRIRFADQKYDVAIPTQEISLEIEWRYRDENREHVRSLECRTSIGSLTVDEEEEEWLQIDEE